MSGQENRDIQGSRPDRGENPSAGSRGQLPANDKASAGSGPAALERRYRALLLWYPAAHRSIYGDEMLGVLMAAASARHQSHPGPAETLNLVGSGLRARLRAIGTGTDPAWRDALAIYSLVAPILATAALSQAPWFLEFLLWGRGPRSGIDPLAVLHLYTLHLPFQVVAWITYVLTMASLLTPVILSLLRLRRTAILTAAVLLSWTTIQAGLSWQIQASNTVALLAMLAVELAALIASDGPRRGLRLLTWKGLLMAVPWLAIAVVVGLDDGPDYANVRLSRYLMVLAIIGIAATLASAKARRLLLLLAIPVSPFVILVRPYGMSPAVMYLAPAFLSLVAFFVSRRYRHKPLAGGDLGTIA
jgi:hypothetical protein